MTLKTSYFNHLKEDRKRRTWTIVVFCLLCFMMTAAFELRLENYLHREYTQSVQLQSNLEDLTSSEMLPAYLFFAVLAAALYGFQGFGWLTKKEQVDFYHSQPMKRQSRFWIIFLNGILLFEIPMLMHMVVTAALVGVRGYLTTAIVRNLLLNLLILTVTFVMCYSLVILSVMMTGNIIISFMTAGTIFVYQTVLQYLIGNYYSTYFDTFVWRYASPLEFINKISPVMKVYDFAKNIYVFNKSNLYETFFITVIMTAVFLLVAYVLYKKRPSECAGCALAFPIMGDIIRFLIVFPVALAFGSIFAAFSGTNTYIWLYFGTILGAVLGHGFMEVIFQFDIRAALGKKTQLMVSIVLSLIVVSIFQFDLLQYDKFIPEIEDVKSVSYYVNIGEYPEMYYPLDEAGVPIFTADNEYYVGDSRISREDFQLEYTKSENAEFVINFVKAYMNHTPAEQYKSKAFLVCYEMKNGKKVYREYYVDIQLLKEVFADVYKTEYGKKLLHPHLGLSGEKVEAVTVYAPFMTSGETTVQLTKDEIIDLVTCYNEDIKNRTFEQLFSNRIIGNIKLQYQNEISNEINVLEIYVSGSDEKMLHFLKEKNIFMELPNEDYIIEEMVAYNPIEADSTKNHSFWKGEVMMSLDPEQREIIIPYLRMEDYSVYGYDEYYSDYYYYIEVAVRNTKTGGRKRISCTLDPSNVPEFIKVN